MGISMNASANAGQATPPRAAPQPSFWATRGVNSVGAVGRINPSRAPRTQGIVRAPAWDDDDSGAAYSPVAASHRGDTDGEAEAEAHEIAVEAAEIADEREVRETLVASGSSTQSQSLIQPQPTQTGGDDEGDASPPVCTIPLPLSPIRAPYRHYTSHSVGAVVPSSEPAPSTSPVRVLPTGTRYGVALGGTGSPGARTATLGGTGGGTGAGMGASPLRAQTTGARWGGGGETPLCARCSGRVYFAEQVRYVYFESFFQARSALVEAL